MSIPARTSPWQPLYTQALFIGPLVENAIEVIKRDQSEALAWAKALLEARAGYQLGASPLAQFRSVRNTDMSDTKFPWCIVEPFSTTADEEGNGAAVAEGHRVSIELAITGKNPEQLTRTLEAYVLAVHMMLTSCTPKDLLAGYGACMNVTWQVTGHDYSRSTPGDEDATAYVRAARMTLEINFSEVLKADG
jgi:hypothetical protein